jgi:1,4-dihydroxy-2-naphthoyl-CoA hydrolase
MPAMTTDIAAMMPFAAHCGITVTAATPAEVKGTLPWRAELCTGAGVLHGGALRA